MMLQTVTFCWFLVAVASAPSSSKSKGDFDMKIVEQGTHFTEKVEVDVERNVEQIEVPPHNDFIGAKYIHDYNMNLTLVLTTGSENCFLSDLSRATQDGYTEQHRELLSALQKAKVQPPENGVTIVANHWTLGDRVREEDVSLSPEMRRLCLGRAIYWLQHMDDSVSFGSHQHNESRLVRHRRQAFVPQCTPGNVMNRCKREVCGFSYFENCERQPYGNHRTIRVCPDKYPMLQHIVDEVQCCRMCCADRSQADDFFPFCDDINGFSCY